MVKIYDICSRLASCNIWSHIAISVHRLPLRRPRPHRLLRGERRALHLQRHLRGQRHRHRLPPLPVRAAHAGDHQLRPRRLWRPALAAAQLQILQRNIFEKFFDNSKFKFENLKILLVNSSPDDLKYSANPNSGGVRHPSPALGRAPEAVRQRDRLRGARAQDEPAAGEGRPRVCLPANHIRPRGNLD